jgi:putative DNA primase/helicase
MKVPRKNDKMTDLKTQVEAAVMARQGKQQGHEIRFQCPVHDDSHPSADYNTEKAVWICRVCGESGNYWHLGQLLGIINNEPNSNGWKETRRWNIGGATHKRLEKAGEKKRVTWEKEGKENLGGLRTADLPLYRIEDVTHDATDLLVNEGEKKTDALLALGFSAVGTVTGAQGLPSVETLRPLADHPGRVFLCRDNDQAGSEHMVGIAARLKRMGKAAYLVSWPGVPEKGDAYDFIKAGHAFGDVQAVLEAAQLYDGDAEPWGYILPDKDGKKTLDSEALINDLLAEFHFATMRDNQEILIYLDGYYQSQGKQFIKAQCQRRVGVSTLLTEHRINEIIGHVIRSTYVDRSDFNVNKFTLNLANGLLDTRTRQLLQHTPDHLSTIRIPVTYDASADCPAIHQFLTDVHHLQDIPVIEEMAGWCLMPDYSIQKAFLLVGDGDNGKSTELALLKSFLGADNCANVPWQALEQNRFATSALAGKLANIFADLSSRSLSGVSTFKMLTGGDAISAEKKFGDPFFFVNYAKLIYSANKPPKVQDEDSFAFWRRWIILEFPNQIADDQKDIHILDKLTTPRELSGLLNLALNGLARLLTAGRFSYDKNVEDTTEYYLRAADPIYAFLKDNVEVSASEWVTKDTLYDAFKEYCVKQCLPVSKPNSFARSLLNQTAFRISSGRPEVDGKRVTVWQGIRLPVMDVNDVNVSSLSKGHAKEDNNALIGIKLEKNVGNPDAIASVTLANPNPDAAAKNSSIELSVRAVRDNSCGGGKDGANQTTFAFAESTAGDSPDRTRSEIGSRIGMDTDQVIAIWRQHGAPVIHLGPGDNCEDLMELLSRSDVSPEQLNAVKVWLEEHEGR